MGHQLRQRSPILFNMKSCILILVLAAAVQAQKADCDYEKELYCPGKWNEDWSKQETPDYCIPNKVGDCWNSCPVDCGKDMVSQEKLTTWVARVLICVTLANFVLLNVTGKKKWYALENLTPNLENKCLAIGACQCKMEIV